MSIKVVKVGDLKEHPINKTIYDLSNLDELASSIKEQGLLEYIVVNKDNVVLSGHRRLTVVRDLLKWDKVTVRIVDIDEADVPRVIVSFNNQRTKTASERISEYKALTKYYKNQRGKRDGEKYNRRKLIASDMGMSEAQLQKYLFVDKHRKTYLKAVTKNIMTINQAWLQTKRELKEVESTHKELGNESSILEEKDWRVYIKSSDDLSGELHDETVDCLITSPPYWLIRQFTSDSSELGQEKTSEEYVQNLCDHMMDWFRVMKKTGSMFINLGDTVYNGQKELIPTRVILELRKRIPELRVLNKIVWHKINSKPLTTNRFQKSYEFIWWLTLSDKPKINEVLTDYSTEQKISYVPRHRAGQVEKQSVNEVGSPKGLNPTNYLYVPHRGGKSVIDYWSEDDTVVKSAVARQLGNTKVQHGAIFPSEIWYLPILKTTDEGDTVLDPFCGSCTIGYVCDHLKRQFVGYDLKSWLK